MNKLFFWIEIEILNIYCNIPVSFYILASKLRTQWQIVMWNKPNDQFKEIVSNWWGCEQIEKPWIEGEKVEETLGKLHWRKRNWETLCCDYGSGNKSQTGFVTRKNNNSPTGF
jgi:hypothetical protein